MAWHALGDAGAVFRLEDRVDPGVSARVRALAALVRAAAVPGVADVVPAYSSLAVAFSADAESGEVLARLRAIDLGETLGAAPLAARTLTVPVRYGGADGPDLEEAARRSRLTPDEVISRHAAAEYVVALIGFQPGFPYLLGLDPALSTPRREAPRPRVPAGSVAIGGSQTGIYPRPSPGGWHLIGRTGLVLFDPGRRPPSLLLPGDRVRFRAVAAGEPATDEAGA